MPTRIQQQQQHGVIINPPASLLGKRNAILWGKAKQYHVAGFPGPLSIKTVVRGSALWEADRTARLVDGSSYLVLNSGRSYSITIDSRETVETFCLFFRQGLAEEVCGVESLEDDVLLDDPASVPGSTCSNKRTVEFFEHLHSHDSVVSPLLRKIYARILSGAATAAWLEDQFLAAARALFLVHGEANQRTKQISAKKPSTRLELYRRLLRGKDYMDSFFGAEIHLEEVARQACLSPYHFHRLFRELFRQTPNQYLQKRRLARAQSLLQAGQQSVTDISLEVGFESITSFANLFRRTFGCSPRQFRAQKNSKIR